MRVAELWCEELWEGNPSRSPALVRGPCGRLTLVQFGLTGRGSRDTQKFILSTGAAEGLEESWHAFPPGQDLV